MDVEVDSGVGIGVEVGAGVEVGVGVEAGDGVVVTPWTGAEVGEAVGLPGVDGETTGDTSSAGVAWGEEQAARNSSVMCSAEISIGRINVIALFIVTDCK